MYKYTEQLANELSTKLQNIDVKANGADFKVKATVEEEDRDGDIVRVKGLETKNYEKNGVVLANHMPFIENIIGKSLSVTKKSNHLEIEGKFASTELANIAKQLYNEGFLNAVSIGFKPKEFQENDKISGMDIVKSELLELSFVGVPANPEALSIDQNSYEYALEKGLISKDSDKKNVKTSGIKDKKDISINTVNFDGVETKNWSEVDKSLTAYINGYYQNTDTVTPEEIPTKVEDLNKTQKRWISSKSLLGNDEASTADELIKFPVVNPQTNRLNKGGLKSAKQFAPQSENLDDDEAKQLQNKIDEMLSENFGEEQNDVSDMFSKLEEKIDSLEQKIDNINEKMEKTDDGKSKDDDLIATKENLQNVSRVVNEALHDLKHKI